MAYNEQETRFYLIDPVLRTKGYDDHQWLKMETPAIPGENIALPPLYYGTVDATPLWACLLYKLDNIRPEFLLTLKEQFNDQND